MRQGKGYRAVLLEAGGLAGFLLQSFEQPGRIFGKLGQIARGAQLSDEPRRMPGGAASELLALEQHSVLDAKLGQMIGDRRADDAAPHNDDIGAGGKGFRHWGKPCRGDCSGRHPNGVDLENEG